MEALTGLLAIAVHPAVHGHRSHPHSRAFHLTLSVATASLAVCRCEVYNLPQARTEVLVHG
jgi:hypothetical protein